MKKDKNKLKCELLVLKEIDRLFYKNEIKTLELMHEKIEKMMNEKMNEIDNINKEIL